MKVERRIRKQCMGLHHFYKIAQYALILLVLHTLAAEAVDDDSLYLYQGTSFHPIQEYIYDKNEYAREGGHVTPSFILTVTWPRVVQFYLPASRLCQEFQHNFIEVAREIRQLSTKVPVQFHSVSCAAHAQLCSDYSVPGVPHVIAFLSGSTEGIALQRTSQNTLNVQYVADTLKIQLEHPETSSDAALPAAALLAPNQIISSSNEQDDEPTVFSDAASSFVYSLHSFHLYNPAPMTPKQTSAFVQWMDLLHWALPARWKLHNLINDLRQNYAAITTHPPYIQTILDSHANLTKHKWSPSCTHGLYDAGYACGLWKLFHIVTIGVAHQHKTVLGDKQRITIQHASKTLRDYVENFFDCQVCAINFLTNFDSCALERCNANYYLQSDSIVDADTRHWQSLALWLWRMHNDINLRRVREDAGRAGRTASEKEETNAFWPSRSKCTKCWNSQTNQWNFDNVYSFLFDEYWPKGISNPRFVVLDKRKYAFDTDIHAIDLHSMFFLWIIVALALILITRNKLKRILKIKWSKNENTNVSTAASNGIRSGNKNVRSRKTSFQPRQKLVQI